MQGPGLLWQNMSVWPVDQLQSSDIEEDDSELKKTITSHAVQMKEAKTMTDLLFSRFSDWRRLKKAVVWLYCFKQWLRSKVNNAEVTDGKISVEEMKMAEDFIVHFV